MSIFETQPLSFFDESKATTYELIDKLIEYLRILVKKIYQLSPTTLIEYRDGNDNIMLPINSFLPIMKSTIQQVEEKKQIMEQNKNTLNEILNIEINGSNQHEYNQQQNYKIDQQLKLQQSYPYDMNKEKISCKYFEIDYQLLLVFYFFIASYGSYEIEKLNHLEMQKEVIRLLKEMKFEKISQIIDNSIK